MPVCTFPSLFELWGSFEHGWSSLRIRTLLRVGEISRSAWLSNSSSCCQSELGKSNPETREAPSEDASVLVYHSINSVIAKSSESVNKIRSCCGARRLEMWWFLFFRLLLPGVVVFPLMSVFAGLGSGFPRTLKSIELFAILRATPGIKIIHLNRKFKIKIQPFFIYKIAKKW